MFVYKDEKGRITDVRGSINVAELERLKKECGEVEVGKAKGEVTAEPGIGPDPDTVAAFEAANAPEPVSEPTEEPSAEGSADEEVEYVDVPNHSDLKGDWVEFAVSQGMDRDEAEASSKQDLIDKFGG